jgi:6-pyruvoyltetrahydropterin/6-carboxytetrahydropterin synthase
MEHIGYALDFKEIKRVGCQWIDDLLDHGMILNPEDEVVIDATEKTGSKLWLMSLNGGKYCNPSVENLAREVFLAQQVLFENYLMLKVDHLRLYETPNCYTDCYEKSITEIDKINFYGNRYESIKKYAKEKGVVEYDDRKTDVVAL